MKSLASSKLTIEELSPNVYHVRASSQYELTSTFMRLQEFYESPFKNIRNRYFTHEQYMDTCAYGTERSAQQRVKFTYLTDWAGFNVPGNVFNRWVDKFSEQYLWDKEEELIDLVYNAIEEGDRFYVIGTSLEEPNTVIDHELSHAWYYLDRKYKKAMLDLVGKLTKTTYKHICKHLAEEGYTEKVFPDETQAYLATNTMSQTKEMLPEGHKIPWDLILQFQEVFEEAKEEKIDDESD